MCHLSSGIQVGGVGILVLLFSLHEELVMGFLVRAPGVVGVIAISITIVLFAIVIPVITLMIMGLIGNLVVLSLIDLFSHVALLSSPS